MEGPLSSAVFKRPFKAISPIRGEGMLRLCLPEAQQGRCRYATEILVIPAAIGMIIEARLMCDDVI